MSRFSRGISRHEQISDQAGVIDDGGRRVRSSQWRRRAICTCRSSQGLGSEPGGRSGWAGAREGHCRGVRAAGRLSRRVGEKPSGMPATRAPQHSEAAALSTLAASCVAPSSQLGDAEFARGGGHSPDEVRDADTEPGQDVLLGRRENGFGEPTGTEQLPEPVPRPGEMQTELARERPRIDPTEQNA